MPCDAAPFECETPFAATATGAVTAITASAAKPAMALRLMWHSLRLSPEGLRMAKVAPSVAAYITNQCTGGAQPKAKSHVSVDVRKVAP